MIDAVRAALETQLAAMGPALATAWENVDFEKVDANTPFQAVTLLPAAPDNPVFGPGFYVERGIMQVTLSYPLGAGPGAAAARAKLVRAQFPRGLSLAAGGVTTTIERTPEIGTGVITDDHYQLPVRIRWYANVNI